MLKHCTQCGAAQEGDARFCAKCGTAIVGAGGNDPMLGKVVVDRYLLVDKIGSGGSGTIYRAEHTTLRKKCAVKILHHQLSRDEHAIERFRREATTVGEIDNEHILQVLDFGRAEDGRLFFAMEHLEGETLTKVLERDGKLPVARVIDILTQVLEALVEAHGLGYIHRDLRPRNIYLTVKKSRADFVKLLDFGLAKLIVPNVEAKQTALGMTFGDPKYMSPEQARGETVDRRADIYSLGVIAYEMIAGAPPYAGGGTFQILQQHLDEPVPSVRASRPDCPEWLDGVVKRAMAKKADDRFLTVFKMLECLREQKSPLSPDEEEREAHAKLTLTAQIKAVGEAFGATPTASVASPAGGTSHAPAPAPAPVAAAPAQPEAHGPTGTLMMPALSVAVAAEAKAAPAPATHAEHGASVVVEGAKELARDKPAAHPPVDPGEDMPTRRVEKAAALPPPSEAKQKDPTGEWFSTGSGSFNQVPRAPGATLVDDEDYEPPKNRAPMIIGGVAGGLTLIGILVLALLPKPQHKASRADLPAEAAQAPAETAAAPPAAAQPTPPAPQANAAPPAPAPAAVEPPKPAPVAEAPKPVEPPTPAPVAEAPKPVAAPPKPAPVAEAPKPVVAPKPVEKPAKPEKAAVATKPDKPEKGAKPDKGTRVASVEHKGKLPEGFKDPFSGESKKSGGESAQAEFFVKLGRQKLNASDLSAASANFNKAREYDPHNPDAFAGLGEVSFEQGDYNGAKINLLQALRLQPNKTRYLVLLGQTYYKLNRPKEAVGEYKKALRIDPNNSEAQRSLEIAERKIAQGG